MEKKELQAKLAVQMKKVIIVTTDILLSFLCTTSCFFRECDSFLCCKVDHFERAKRSIEIPKRHEQYRQKLIDDEEFHHNQETNKVCLHVACPSFHSVNHCCFFRLLKLKLVASLLLTPRNECFESQMDRRRL